MAGRRGFRCALCKRAYPGMFVAVGAVSNRATLARDRPSRYDKGEGYRSAGAVTPIPTRCRFSCRRLALQAGSVRLSPTLPPRAFSCLNQDFQDDRSLAVVRCALTKRAYPKTVGAVSNRAKNRRRGFKPRKFKKAYPKTVGAVSKEPYPVGAVSNRANSRKEN